jgi:hypothetical protein
MCRCEAIHPLVRLELAWSHYKVSVRKGHTARKPLVCNLAYSTTIDVIIASLTVMPHRA